MNEGVGWRVNPTLMAITGNGKLIAALAGVQADPLEPFVAVNRVIAFAISAQVSRKRLFFIGNGGSAAIAGHMAADWSKAGGFRAQCFNDAPLVTCLANDTGYENVFAFGIHQYADAGDLLFAISSSGKSPSILNAVHAGNERGLTVITLSGFEAGNLLRAAGAVNFYVPSRQYGIVEVAHHAILHAILDRVTGCPSSSTGP